MNGNVIAGGLRQAITRHWWVLLVRGLVSVLLGVMAFGSDNERPFSRRQTRARAA
jgi:uncharacterized membrane protein HdeD (DUF308 family)